MASALITSHDNRLFKTWASLQSSKGIDKHGLALVSGRKIVPELLVERGGAGATLLLCENAKDSPLPVREGARGRGSQGLPPPSPSAARSAPPVEGGAITVAMLSRALFEALDEFGTDAPLLVLPAPKIGAYTEDEARPGLVLGVAAQDPANLGAILRSALAFDASEVVLFSESAHPFLPRVTRAAAGANFRVKPSKGPSIRAAGEEWLALDMKGEPVDVFDFPRDCRLLLGEEGLGIPESFKGRRLAIPISPKAESLNVAVAAGIALAVYRRQYPLA